MSKKKTTQPAKPSEPELPSSFETFRPISIFGYDMNSIRQDEPSAFNGWVRVEKYRVTVEKVDESIEVIQQRIQDLWDVCDNHHHWTPLRNKAKQFGYELIGDPGNKIKKP